MSAKPGTPEYFATLYRQAFENFRASAFWNGRPVRNPTPDDALAITGSLRVEGDLRARRLAGRITLEIAEAVVKRLGQKRATELFDPIWNRPILKSDTNGLHGTLFYDYFEKRRYLPKSKREIDRVGSQINSAQRDLYRQARGISPETRPKTT